LIVEDKVIDRIEIIENWAIQVRIASIVSRDSIEIARTYERYSLQPGDSLEEQPDLIKNIANAAWAHLQKG